MLATYEHSHEPFPLISLFFDNGPMRRPTAGVLHSRQSRHDQDEPVRIAPDLDAWGNHSAPLFVGVEVFMLSPSPSRLSPAS